MELFDSILAEERHVFTDGEGEVISMVLFLEHDLVSESLTEPSDILGRGESIDISGEKHGWNVVVLNRHARDFFLAVDLHVLDGSVVVEVVVSTVDHLAVVNEGAVALA